VGRRLARESQRARALKAFIRFCLKREWIAKNIADDLQAPEGSSVTVPKSPFTDAEIQKLYAACDEIGPLLKQGPRYHTWGGEDVIAKRSDSIYKTGKRTGLWTK
jgi:hypothetical protein